MNTLSTDAIGQRIADRLNQASQLLVQRRAADAASLLSSLVAEQPRLAEARRLLGLALRELGDLAGAERELRAGLALSARADIHEALAATLEAAGRRNEAEQAYRDALALDPAFSRGAIGLSELLLNENRLDEALLVIAPAGGRADADIHILSAHALALKALGRIEEAVDVYRRAIQVAPRSGVAEHNLAAVLCNLDRFSETEAGVRRAFAKGLDSSQTWLLLGRALQGQDRFAEAEQAYFQALSRRPDDPDAHAEFAQLAWMRTEDALLSGENLTTAITAFPANAPLKAAKARLLEYAGDLDGAYAMLCQAISVAGSDAGLQARASHIVARRDPDLALAHAERAVALAPDSADALNALCLANLAAGQAEAAAALAGQLRVRAPLDQQAIALQATAWRLLDDPRHAGLCDYEGTVRAWTLDTPAGWSSLGVFLADLAESLMRLHALRTHPIGQSLRHGSQTQRRLDRSDDPVIRAFFQAIDGPIRRHLSALGQGDDPVRSRNTGAYDIQGSWSVRLRPGGYHTDHLHPKGWLSSACHILVPEAAARGHEGWLKFGEPGVPTKPALSPEKFIRPEPGALILFPSSLWHGTVPFTGDEPRLSIAFDLLPG